MKARIIELMPSLGFWILTQMDGFAGFIKWKPRKTKTRGFQPGSQARGIS
jgi:hypothetical protein